MTFNFEAITRAPNTSLSHQLIALAPQVKRPALIETVYDAYFEYGQDIGDLDLLVEIAERHGLDPQVVRKKLAAGDARAQVERSVAEAQAVGITGVPFFVIDNQYAFSGAQPPEAMRRILQQISAQVAPE